jgi:hypothetical protein
VTQAREALRAQLAGARAAQLRDERVERVEVGVVAEALDQDEALGLGLAEQVLDLARAVGRVHGDHHDAGLC